jgi:GT2 family glycosyltransferase
VDTAGPGRKPIATSDVTAVVVNWETPDYTIRAVRAIVDDGVEPEQVVIVDNGSQDGSYEQITDELPACTVLHLEENVGYARAANLGVRARKADSYLLINNDAFVHRAGSMRALVEGLGDPSVGIVSARVLTADLTPQPIVAAFQTPGVALVRASGLSRWIPNRWQPDWGTYWDQSSAREVQAVSTVAVLVRAEAWEQLGGFDQRMYFYGEDIDLCFRARRLGWKVWFTPDAEFLHIGGGSTSTRWSNLSRCEQIGRSEARMMRRNLSPLAAYASLTFISLGLAGRYVAFSLRGRRHAADAMRATLRGFVVGAIT